MQKFEEIIQRTWNDASFKQKFISDPKSVLKEYGNEIGENLQVSVHDDSQDTMHFVLLDKSQMAGTNLKSDPIVGKVMTRAHEDASYKKRLLSDPKNAVQEVLGIKAPANVQVHENTSRHLHIVLPANPDSSGELSDSDLAMVAGGKGLAINCDSVGGFMGKTGEFAGKVGDFFGENAFGRLFDSLGPLLTGGGNMLTKVSGFFNNLKNGGAA
ncbi:NHLP leader peptide family RiPP precursor [Deltaproteobacteria bacterium TL4]